MSRDSFLKNPGRRGRLQSLIHPTAWLVEITTRSVVWSAAFVCRSSAAGTTRQRHILALTHACPTSMHFKKSRVAEPSAELRHHACHSGRIADWDLHVDLIKPSDSGAQTRKVRHHNGIAAAIEQHRWILGHDCRRWCWHPCSVGYRWACRPHSDTPEGSLCRHLWRGFRHQFDDRRYQ